MSLLELHTERTHNPVDVVERLAALHDWSFDRAGDDEIAISVRGRWTDYHVSFTWMDDIEALHLACAFDLKVPEPRRTDVLALIEQGATDVYAYITHGVLSGGAVARITASRLKELVITDSIQPTEAVRVARNMRVLSIATLLGEAITRTAGEESVSSLFD